MSRQPPFPATNGRIRSRPTTPTGSSPVNGIPVRPMRSAQRESTSTRSDYSVVPPGPPPRSTRRMDSQDSPVTPSAMGHVMEAFGQAARRRQRTGDDEYYYEQERLREEQEERRRQARIRERTPGRRTGRPRQGDIDAVLDEVKDGWEFVIDPDFNSVDLALQLLDDNAYGKNIDSFRRTKQMLSKALKGSVDKHYQAFASALPHHASLLSHLSTSQTQIGTARTSLQEAKDALGSKRADLVQLWSRGQTLEEMLRILDQIEHLKSVPDSLETLMSEKRLLQAAVLLVRSLKIINNSEMMEIGAVADLRNYLVSQETSLREILVDELQSHLYLKSFWCDSRWAAYVPNQKSFPKIEFEEDFDPSKATALQETSPTSPSFRRTRLTHFINELTLRPNDPPHDLDDAKAVLIPSNVSTTSGFQAIPGATGNPEADSLSYMETLLESLAVLGKLGISLDTIAQRLPGEIYTLVETTLDEVEDRAEYARRGLTSQQPSSRRAEAIFVFGSGTDSVGSLAPSGGLVPSSCLRMGALESSVKQADQQIIQDLFWTLYSKLDAVAQGLRVVYEVANRIGSRRDFKDSSGAKVGALFPIGELWQPVQAEVRTLLYDYLTDEEQGSVAGRNPIASINEVLREGRLIRDKTKAVFRFADTDLKLANKSLRSHEEELTRVLKDTVPGLVQSSADNAVQSTLSSVGPDDQLLGAGQHHRTLIQPDPFHVSVLFQPSLAFLEKISDVLPSGGEIARAGSVVLDDFVLKVYLPQLEDKVESLFHQAVHGSEAFQEDPSSTRLSPKPLMKASTHLMALINSLCAMLQTSPFHRENYSRLILSIIIQFYQKCSDRFQDLVSMEKPEGELDAKLALAAQWSQRPEVIPCLSELLLTKEEDVNQRKQLCRQETHLESDFLDSKPLNKGDLIVSIRNLGSLASLYHSVSWFVTELSSLRTGPEQLLSPTSALEPPTAITPFTPFLPTMPVVPPQDSLNLPLSKEMAMRFQALLKTFEQMASMILDTVRIDLRCRAIHYIEASMRHGDYSAEREAGEPDPHIMDFNNELSDIEHLFSASLPQKEHDFVFVGLGDLMEHLLISRARFLRCPSSMGIRRLLRNILALQQNMKTIADDSSISQLERARRYYKLFYLRPQDMLAGIRKKQEFTFDDYQLMLNFQCGVDTTQEGTEPKDRNYSMYMIDLHGLELEDSKL